MNDLTSFKDNDNAVRLAESKPRAEDYPIILWDEGNPGNAILLRDRAHYLGSAWWLDNERMREGARYPLFTDNEPVTIFTSVNVSPAMRIEWSDAMWSPLRREYLQNESREPSWVGRSKSEEHDQYLSKITEQLHELADDNNWCSEFDGIMEGAGLKSRVVQMRVSVRVEFTAVIQYPSSDQDVWLSQQISVDVEADRVVIDGSTTIDLYRDGVPDEEPEIDHDEVVEALEMKLEAALDEVVDYSIVGCEQVD